MKLKVVRDDLQYKRENAETSLFKRCHSQVCAVAALTDIQPTMSRVASRQILNRQDAESDAFQYYLKNVCYPFLDHLIQGTDNRSDKYGSTVYLTYGLIPSVIGKRDITVKYKKMTVHTPLPSSLKACDHEMYLNLHVLLRTSAAIRVNSSEYE